MRLSELYARAAGPSLDHAEAIARASALVGTDKDIDAHLWLSKLAQAEARERAEALEKLRGVSGALDREFRQRDYAPGDVALPFLPNFSVGYMDGVTYIADMVSPIVKGNVQRRYAKFSRRDASRILDLKVGPKAFPAEASIDVSNSTYLEVGYAERAVIANKDIADAADLPQLLSVQRRAIEYDLIRGREYRVATLIMTAANYAAGCTSALSSTNRWDVGSATSTADPVYDINVTAMTASGVAGRPNAGVCSRYVFEILRRHPKVIAVAGPRAMDRLVSANELRDMFGLQYLFIGDAKYDTQGSASSANYSFIWGKGFALIHVLPGAKQEDPSFCKTFRHNELVFSDFYDPRKGVSGTTELKGSHADAEIVVANDRGYLLDTVVS